MHSQIKPALLLIRVGFGAFLLTWGLNKILNPEGAAGIFAKYYGIDQLGTMPAVVLGSLQVAISLCIITGLFKTVSYALGVLIHGASTVSTASHLVMPFAEGSNLLFMAGLPVFTAAIGLFIARSQDTLLSVDALIGTTPEAAARTA